MAESTRMYPDSLELLWENKAIGGGSPEDVQISGDIKSVVCELVKGDVLENPFGFVELFRSGPDSFDGMYVYMVDRDVVVFYEYQLSMPTEPAPAGVPTWNTCKGFIKGSGSAPGTPVIYRIYAGRRVDDS